MSATGRRTEITSVNLFSLPATGYFFNSKNLHCCFSDGNKRTRERKYKETVLKTGFKTEVVASKPGILYFYSVLYTMRKFSSIIPFLLFAVCTRSQQLSQVTFTGASALSHFTFITDQNVLIRVSPDGNVMEWGTEIRSERSSNYYAPKLQPFMGRVDYYGPETTDSAYRGKVKSIGTCRLTYYGAYEMEGKPGKLKSIGSIGLDYYTRFENAAVTGKLRFAGTLVLEYYPSLENEAFKGKLKSVGNTRIAYHSTFDDKLIQGKIKSIGPVVYTWGTSLDARYKGSLKSGLYRQNINGVTYILQ